MPRITSWKGPRKFGPSSTQSFSTFPQIFSVTPNRGRVGVSVSVTIRGANFRNCAMGTPPQVKFGGLSATNVVVVDAGTITCDTPIATSSGLVDLTVTVGCCS